MMTYEERYENYRDRIAAGMSLDDMSAEISLLADKIQNVIDVAMQKEQFETQLKAYHQALALQEWKEEIAKEEEDRNHTSQVIFSVAKVAVLGAVAFFAPPLLPTVAPFVGAVGSASNMIATGLICGVTDAAAQGVAVDLGLQSRFSVNELLETAFSSGVGSGTVGLNAIEQTAVVAATATGTQFTEIALGLKEKFEPQAVALQAASAAIARGLHEVLPSLNQTLGESDGSLIAKTAVNSAINSVLSHVVTGTPISFEQMATEISGKLIACKVGEALANNSSQKTKNTEVERVDVPKVSTPKLNPLQAQGLFGKSQIESTINQAILSGDWEKAKASMLESSKANGDAAVAVLNIPGLDLSHIKGGDIRCANLPEVKSTPTNSTDNAVAKTSTSMNMAQALDDAIKRAKMDPNIPHETPLEPVYPEFWLWGAADAAKLGVGLWKLAGSGASKVARAAVSDAVRAPIKHPLTGLSTENVVRLADEIGLETPTDQLLLWSGLGRSNAGIQLSQEFARANGGITLEMTKGGQWLTEMDLFGPNSPFTQKEAIQIWKDVSIKMIQQASGQVRALVGQVKPDSTYMAERAEILINKAITGIDELNLKPRVTFGNKI